VTDDRKLGLDFGDLRSDLESETYPLSKEELLDSYGDREIGTENGSQTFRDILEPVDQDTYESADAVEQTVLTMVDESAEGRVGYSDRGIGENDSDQQSL